jgi:serine/threonine-protein kinase RsbW
VAEVSLKDKILITNDTKYLVIVRDFLARMITQTHLPKSDENKIVLAVDEAITNVIEHAYEEEANGDVEVEIDVDSIKFCVYIRDHGKYFNPCDVPDIDVMEKIKEGRKKGFGIFLMRRVMDEVRYEYNRKEQKNELALIKYIRVAK